jgi:hypothetical protein
MAEGPEADDAEAEDSEVLSTLDVDGGAGDMDFQGVGTALLFQKSEMGFMSRVVHVSTNMHVHYQHDR